MHFQRHEQFVVDVSQRDHENLELTRFKPVKSDIFQYVQIDNNTWWGDDNNGIPSLEMRLVNPFVDNKFHNDSKVDSGMIEGDWTNNNYKLNIAFILVNGTICYAFFNNIQEGHDATFLAHSL